MTDIRYQCEQQAGSSRQKLRVACVVFVSAIASLTALGQQIPTRFPITSAQILGVMQYQELPTSGAKVQISAPVTASVADAQLDLRSGTIVSAHEMRLRMGCRIHVQCLPFFVNATWPDNVDVSALPIKQERHLVKASEQLASISASSVADAKNVSSKANEVAMDSKRSAQNIQSPAIAMHSKTGESGIQSASVVNSPADTPAAIALRSGSPATLEIEGDRLHIRMDVICLENGVIGDKVRVSSRDHKQVYTAQIITPALLKGTL